MATAPYVCMTPPYSSMASHLLDYGGGGGGGGFGRLHFLSPPVRELGADAPSPPTEMIRVKKEPPCPLRDPKYYYVDGRGGAGMSPSERSSGSGEGNSYREMLLDREREFIDMVRLGNIQGGSESGVGDGSPEAFDLSTRGSISLSLSSGGSGNGVFGSGSGPGESASTTSNESLRPSLSPPPPGGAINDSPHYSPSEFLPPSPLPPYPAHRSPGVGGVVHPRSPQGPCRPPPAAPPSYPVSPGAPPPGYYLPHRAVPGATMLHRHHHHRSGAAAAGKHAMHVSSDAVVFARVPEPGAVD